VSMSLLLSTCGRAADSSSRHDAEQSDEPDEALELKMLHTGPGLINVRFAGYAYCSADGVRSIVTRLNLFRSGSVIWRFRLTGP
jgi:hypothetical protein